MAIEDINITRSLPIHALAVRHALMCARQS